MPTPLDPLGMTDQSEMAQETLRPKATVALLALIVAALVLVVVHGAILLDRIGASGEADLDIRTWLVARLEVDHKAFQIALLHAQHAPEWTAETQRSVVRAFDIYYSRVTTVTAALAKGFGQNSVLDQIDSSRDAMASLIDQAGPLRAPDIAQLTDMAGADVQRIRDITNRSIMMFTQIAESQRVAHRNVLIRLGVLMGFLVILMTIAVILALRISREADRRAQQAARTVSNLRRTFEASLDGVMVSDGAGTLTYLNAAAVRMFGTRPSDLLGASITETVLRRLVRGGALEQIVDTGRHRLTGLHQSGREFPIEVSFVSDHDCDGRLIFIGFLRDVTAEVEAETKLRDARDQARRDAAAKSRFLALMSHEMRTPLHGVLAALDLIRPDALRGSDQQFLATARACGASALDQVDEVLELTRRGTTEGAVSTFDAPRLTAEMVADMTPLATKRGNRLTFTCVPDAGIAPVLGWRRGFLLALRNLISNAVKFTQGGEISVTLTCTPEPEGKLALTVEVRDTGAGIDPTDHERVFHEFETLDTNDRVGTGGIGLGLAIARSAAESMGGTIVLQSALGQGSRFSLHLVLETSAPGALPPPAARDTPRVDDLYPSHKARRILVVDDNPVNLALMAEMLLRLGHLPEMANSGPVALDLAMREAFDLILMDIGMPGMDGMATTRALRAGGASAFSPVVAVTALLLEEDRVLILDAGMQDILRKPIGLSELRAFLDEFFADHLPMDDDDFGFEEVRTLMGDVILAQLVEAVLQDAHAALTALRGLDDAADMRTVEQVLHRAAGSAAVIGLTKLSAALSKGEMAARSQELCELRLCEFDIRLALSQAAAHLRDQGPDLTQVLDRFEPTGP